MKRIIFIVSLVFLLTNCVQGGKTSKMNTNTNATQAMEKQRAGVDLSTVFDTVLLNELEELTASWITEYSKGYPSLVPDSILSMKFYMKNGDCYVDIYTDYTYWFEDMAGSVIMNDFLVVVYIKKNSCYRGLVHIDKLLKDKPEERFYEDLHGDLMYDGSIGKRFKIDPGTRSLTLVKEGFL